MVIYKFLNEEGLSTLEKIKIGRMLEMEKDVKPYKQRGMTCAIACMLMVLEYYKIIPKADWIYERKYYRAYHSKYMDGTPFSALAWHFAKNNLDTEIIHSEQNMFNNSNNILSEEVYINSMKEYSEFLNSAVSKGAKVSNGCNITCDSIREKIEAGKMVILAGKAYGDLHAILICGYNEKVFVVCDPLFKQKKLMTHNEVDDYMNTPLGKWCVVVGEKTKNDRC